MAIDALSALTDNASSSIKTGNVITFCVSISFCDDSYYILRPCYYLRRLLHFAAYHTFNANTIRALLENGESRCSVKIY